MIRPTGARPAPGTTEILELLDRALGGGIVIASGRAPVLVSHAPAATGARFVVAAFETYLQHSDPTGETDVAALLHGVASALTEALGAVRGRIELGLNVVWDRDKVLSELEGDQAAIRRLKKRSLTRQRVRPTSPRVQLGRLVEEALEARAKELMWGVYESSGPCRWRAAQASSSATT